MKVIKRKLLAVVLIMLTGVTLAYAGVQVEKTNGARGIVTHPALCQLAAGYANASLAL